MFNIKLYKIGLKTFRVTSEAYTSNINGDASGPVWIKGFICVGTETSIDDCDWRQDNYCDPYYGVSINCLPPNGELIIVLSHFKKKETLIYNLQYI